MGLCGRPDRPIHCKERPPGAAAPPPDRPGECFPACFAQGSVPRTPQESGSACRGAWAEGRALALLRRSGWTLLSRNWRCRWGELDLVLAKPGRLLVVEVKGRAPGGRDGQGRAALHAAKRRRLERAWACWLACHPERAALPVELVAALVPLPPPGQAGAAAAVRWIRLEI
jgi:putative endonuclease